METPKQDERYRRFMVKKTEIELIYKEVCWKVKEKVISRRK